MGVNLGVSLYLPTKAGRMGKRPFMTIAPATGKALGILAEDGHTFSSADVALSHLPEGVEERQALRGYIDAGYGEVVMSDWWLS